MGNEPARLDIEEVVLALEIIKSSIGDYKPKKHFDKLEEQAFEQFGIMPPFEEEWMYESDRDWRLLWLLKGETLRRYIKKREKALIRYIQENAEPNYWNDEVDCNLSEIGIAA